MSAVKVLVMAGMEIVLDGFKQEKKAKSKFEETEGFIEDLISYLKENGIDKSSYLVFIGNFTQDGVPAQYYKVMDVIKKLSEGLCIEKQNIMLVPGLRDISVTYIRNKIGEDPDWGKTNLMDEKLCHFKTFYEGFFEHRKKFTPSSIIWDQIEIPQLRTVLLSINTLTKYSHQNLKGKGHIDNSELNKWLDLKQQCGNNFKILFGYNGFAGEGEGNLVDNASEIQNTLSHYKVHVFFNRVEEIDSYKKETSDINYHIGISDIGGGLPSFLIMESETDTTNHSLFRLKYHDYRVRDAGRSYWQPDTNNPNVVTEIPINSPTGTSALSRDLERVNLQDDLMQVDSSKQIDEPTIIDDCFGYKDTKRSDEVNKYLIKIIRKNKLFMSGHFHWSKNGRSLSFIKTEFFFENYDCLERVKILYKWMIEDYKLLQDPITIQQIENNRNCLLIGYAMPGVLVGTQLATYYKTPFSYIPAFIKYHTEDETEIPDGDFDSVTVIIDMIFKSHIIDWILERLFEKKRIKASLKRVNIITLFWGDGDGFKSSELKISKNIKNKRLLDVKLYYISKFPLDKCNYPDKNKCPVYCKKIAPVHVLSSEDYYENNRTNYSS